MTTTIGGSYPAVNSDSDATINGLTVGKGGGSLTNNTAVGANALSATNTGSGLNTAVGVSVLASNTSGQENSAFGVSSLGSNTTGSYNVGIGRSALASNTTASNNTAVGYQAGYSNTTSTDCTFLGYQAGYSGTTSMLGNTFIGSQAGRGATAGGNQNTAIGYYAGYSIGTGQYNVYIGGNNTTGGAGYASTGSNNSFIGSNSGYAMTTGSNNSIFGNYSGNQGGLDIRTASNYIVLSDGAGNPRGIFDNSGNFAVGGTGFNGRVSIFGQNADWNLNSNVAGSAGGTKLHIRFIGDSAVAGTVTSSGTTTAYNTSSDYRLKEDVQPMVNALDKVALLKPCTYKWKADGSDGQGFIAHELQAVFPDAVFGEKDGLDKDGNIQPQGVDSSFLVATLVKAIQELKAEVDSLKQQLGK